MFSNFRGTIVGCDAWCGLLMLGPGSALGPEVAGEVLPVGWGGVEIPRMRHTAQPPGAPVARSSREEKKRMTRRGQSRTISSLYFG